MGGGGGGLFTIPLGNRSRTSEEWQTDRLTDKQADRQTQTQMERHRHVDGEIKLEHFFQGQLFFSCIVTSCSNWFPRLDCVWTTETCTRIPSPLNALKTKKKERKKERKKESEKGRKKERKGTDGDQNNKWEDGDLYLCTVWRVPGSQPPQQCQPIRTSQFMLRQKIRRVAALFFHKLKHRNGEKYWLTPIKKNIYFFKNPSH